MSRKLIVVTVLLLAIIGSGVFLITSKSDNSDLRTMVDKTKDQNSDISDTPTPSSATKGAYIDYNQSVIANTAGTKLLFFHAPWCPQCRTLEADIIGKGVPAGVTIIKVDYDSNQELRKKYGVTLQTTIVRVDDQGNLLSKFVAYTEPSLEAVIQNTL